MLLPLTACCYSHSAPYHLVEVIQSVTSHSDVHGNSTTIAIVCLFILTGLAKSSRGELDRRTDSSMHVSHVSEDVCSQETLMISVLDKRLERTGQAVNLEQGHFSLAIK